MISPPRLDGGRPEHVAGPLSACDPDVFVPELHRSRAGLQTIFLAIGEHGAIGTAPFGIDELQDDERPHLRQAYRQLAAVAADILDAQATNRIRGFVVTADESTALELEAYRITISTNLRFGSSPDPRPDFGYGLIIALGPDEFVVAGSGFRLGATTVDGAPTVLHTVQELDVEPASGRASGQAILRWLNGDETLSGHAVSVSGDVVTPWPSGIPKSPSITGPVRFSLLPLPPARALDPRWGRQATSASRGAANCALYSAA